MTIYTKITDLESSGWLQRAWKRKLQAFQKKLPKQLVGPAKLPTLPTTQDRFIQHSNLSLEKDFGYKGRSFLLTNMQPERWNYRRHFQDRVEICPVLVTSHNVGHDPKREGLRGNLQVSVLQPLVHKMSYNGSIFKKSLFATLKNYNYKAGSLALVISWPFSHHTFNY